MLQVLYGGTHLRVLTVRLVKRGTEAVGAGAQGDAIVRVDDLEVPFARVGEVAVAGEGLVDDTHAVRAYHVLDVGDRRDVEVTRPQHQSMHQRVQRRWWLSWTPGAVVVEREQQRPARGGSWGLRPVVRHEGHKKKHRGRGNRRSGNQVRGPHLHRQADEYVAAQAQ